MLNRSGIQKQSYMATRQILADVANQYAVGCVVPQSLGVAVGNKKIAKAGTPINIDTMNTLTPVKKPVAASEGVTAVPMNSVLVHDVDVTNGNANGTALLFGFVNVNRVESDVATLITSARAITGATPLLTFVKL